VKACIVFTVFGVFDNNEAQLYEPIDLAWDGARCDQESPGKDRWPACVGFTGASQSEQNPHVRRRMMLLALAT